MILIEIEVGGKRVQNIRSEVVPAVGDVMSVDNEYVAQVVRRHWVIDKPPSLKREFRCILECKKK